jgi:hypothetical protein
VIWGVTAAIVLAAGAHEKPRLVILDLTAQAGVEHDVAVALTDAVAVEVGKRGYFEALSSRDMQTLLGVERQKQLLGCNEEGSCLTELAGALGARYVMTGAIARLGDAFQLTLQTLDTQKASPLGRSLRLAKDLSVLRSQVAYAVAEATATPLPAAPSHALSYSVMGAGGALVVAGGIVGLYALSQESLLQTEIDQGQQNPNQLKTYASYTQARSQYGVDRTVSLVGMLTGAALIGAGIYLNPDAHGAVSVALAPLPHGAAFVLSWH